jgi:hypothetical protein
MSGLDIPRLIDCLEELGNRSFQERAWLGARGTEMSSFSEQVSQTFDDTGLSVALEKGTLERAVDREAARALEELSASIDRVDQSLSPAMLLDDPAVERVRARARQASDRLRQAPHHSFDS